MSESEPRERPDRELLTAEEEGTMGGTTFFEGHTREDKLEALATGRWMAMWDPIDVEKVR